MPETLAPRRRNCAVSMWRPWRTRTSATIARMHADRSGFEPQHGARREANVAIRHGRGDEDRDGGQQRGGSGPARGGLQENIGVLHESAGDGDGGGNVSKEQRPSREAGGPGGERFADVFVERAGRGGAPREAADEDADEGHARGREHIDEPGAVAGHGEDQRNGHGGRGGGRDGGDRLREGFRRRQDAAAEPVALSAPRRRQHTRSRLRTPKREVLLQCVVRNSAPERRDEEPDGSVLPGCEVMSRLEWHAGNGFGFGDLFEVRDQRFHFGDRPPAPRAVTAKHRGWLCSPRPR